MKTVNLLQGSESWHAHRAQHWNASDAPAMLGVSPYKSRAELLRERATGISQEFDAATQRRFDDGHRFEALARSLAEKIVGDELFPVTGVEGRYSASFDGLTMLEDTAFEHKSINDELRDAIQPNNSINAIPEHYRVQMEQQCMVSGATRVLFMASKWGDDGELIEERHCWYYPDPELRARIVAGWEQFERDLENYVPEVVAPKPVAAPVAGFGALSLVIEGRVLASNLDAFKAGADAFIARLPKPEDLQSDQDFADADAAVKACEDAESRIKTAKEMAQAQMTDVDAVFRAADHIAATIRSARLALAKVVESEKDRRRADIIAGAVRSVGEHYGMLNASLGRYAINPPSSLSSEIGAAVKGKRTLTSITDAANTAAANAKIAASQRAEVVRANAAMIDADTEHATLYPDAVSLVTTMTSDNLKNLMFARIAEHAKREEAKLEAERQRIRAEEQAKAERAAREELVRLEQQRAAEDARIAAEAKAQEKPLPPVTMTVVQPQAFVAPAQPAAQPSSRTMKLGDVNAALAPLSITAEGLASIGFQSCGQDRAAKLYRADDLPAILRTLAQRLHMASQSGVAA
jgi:putative phage-type endonuclease